jgi:hypothetical protein
MLQVEKIYLDIDGVILNHNYEQMPHLREFVKAVFDVVGDEVYWLSTHSKHGDSDIVFEHIGEIVDRDILDMLERVKNSKWDTLKIEGIDLNSEFIWFDDNVFDKEYRVLEDIGKEHCLIKVKENLDEMVEYLNEFKID